MSPEEAARVEAVYRDGLPRLLAEVTALATAPMTPAAAVRYLELTEVWAGMRLVLCEYENALARWN